MGGTSPQLTAKLPASQFRVGQTMSLSDLASLGSFVSGVAVLISLIYLALQVRQAEKYQRALMQQGRADRIVDVRLRLAEPGIADMSRRALRGEDLTALELSQFNSVFRAELAARQDIFVQHSEHMMHEDAFKQLIMTTRELMSNPGARAMWRRLRLNYAASYRDFVDQRMREAPTRRTADDLVGWREGVAAELEGTA
jgi:hypothetical protein